MFGIDNSIFFSVMIIDEEEIKGIECKIWNIYHFVECQGKGIEIEKTTMYEKLLRIICHILKID